MSNPDQDLQQVDQLVQQYESGGISRRDLVKSLALLGGAAAVASACQTTPSATTTVRVASDPDKGRKVLLERIMNHTYREDSNGVATLHNHEKSKPITTILAGAPVRVNSPNHGLVDGDRVLITGVADAAAVLNDTAWYIEWVSIDQFKLLDSSDVGAGNNGTWETYSKIFESSEAHQEWLFGKESGPGNYVDGLRQYDDRFGSRNYKALNDDINVASKRRHKGEPFQNGQENNLRLMIAEAHTGVNVYQLSGMYSDKYNYADLYGLVRQKLQYTGDHCAHHVAHAIFFVLLDFDRAPGNCRTVKWTDSDGKIHDIPTAKLFHDLIIQENDGDADYWDVITNHFSPAGSDDPITVEWDHIDELVEERGKIDPCEDDDRADRPMPGVGGSHLIMHGGY